MKTRNFKQLVAVLWCTLLLCMFGVGNVFAAQTVGPNEKEQFISAPEQQEVIQELAEIQEVKEELTLWDRIMNPIGPGICKKIDQGSSEEQQPEEADNIYATTFEEQQPVEEVEEKGVIPIATSCNATPIATSCNTVKMEEVIEPVPKEGVVGEIEEPPIEDAEEMFSTEMLQLGTPTEGTEGEQDCEGEVMGVAWENLIPLGVYRTTAYCPCSKCNGKWTTTATGVAFQEEHTVAVDPKVIPLNSRLIINGIEYKAEDTGGAIKGNRIDIFHGTHQQALCYGVRYAEVYLVAA